MISGNQSGIRDSVTVMTLRTSRERVIQTLAYEAGGLVVATPLFALAFGTDGSTSFLLLASLSLAMLLWSPLHNTFFDVLEWRSAHRLASDRPQLLRMVHAVSHEATSLVVTLPVLMAFGGLGLVEALFADFGLTAIYSAYAYAFHIVFDHFRPVPAPVRAGFLPEEDCDEP